MTADFSWERTVGEYLKVYALAGENQGAFVSSPGELVV
jgi:hypothetical protein